LNLAVMSASLAAVFRCLLHGRIFEVQEVCS
jgi:hypothetical protein